MWNPTPGHYTRYGDTSRPCCAHPTIGSSSWARAMSRSSLRRPRCLRCLGWRRDYLLVDGWAKTATPTPRFLTVEPAIPGHERLSLSSQRAVSGHAGLRDAGSSTIRPALRLLRALHESGTQSKQRTDMNLRPPPADGACVLGFVNSSTLRPSPRRHLLYGQRRAHCVGALWAGGVIWLLIRNNEYRSSRSSLRLLPPALASPTPARACSAPLYEPTSRSGVLTALAPSSW